MTFSPYYTSTTTNTNRRGVGDDEVDAECPVCYEEFGNENDAPWLQCVRCGQRVCVVCIQSLLLTQNTNIMCPFCRSPKYMNAGRITEDTRPSAPPLQELDVTRRMGRVLATPRPRLSTRSVSMRYSRPRNVSSQPHNRRLVSIVMQGDTIITNSTVNITINNSSSDDDSRSTRRGNRYIRFFGVLVATVLDALI